MITTTLKEWLQDGLMDFTATGDVITIGQDRFIELIKEENESIINTKEDNTLSLLLTPTIINEILQDNVDYIIYRFGGNYYYTPIHLLSDILLTPFRGIGISTAYVSEEAPVFLGIHGRYEQMSGVRDYSEWCKKAKFLKYQYLGICEKHTLSGTLPFQLECNKQGLIPIFGYTLDIAGKYDIRVFARNADGWQRLLEINKWINVDKVEVKEDFLLQDNSSLIAILPPGLDSYKHNFHKAYYQITTNEYLDDKKDKELLNALQAYISSKIDLEPILLSDAYCTEKTDIHVRKVLNKGGGKHSISTDNHYFKSMGEEFILLSQLFKDDDTRLEEIFDRCLISLAEVKDLCNFQINTKELFLPKYEMTKEETDQYGDTNTMFLSLIEKGIDSKIGEWNDVINERLDREISLIQEGGFADYFLILWDIVEFCKRSNIEYGMGRGSAAGSLVSYSLGIVRVNPLKYGLYFERFMNIARIKEELPDLDYDVSPSRREDVIDYIKFKYGNDFVCQVGAYTSLKMKGGIKELARNYGINGDYNINIVTSLITGKENNDNWVGLFIEAIDKSTMRNFIKDNPDLINDSQIVLNAIKTSSIHASAVIILPKNGKSIYQQIPVKGDSEGNLISEWEGDEMAKAGYLKEDILGLNQLDKIGNIISLIETNTGRKINVEEIDLDCAEVFAMLTDGSTCDVFQFNTPLATSYLKQMKPTHVNDLIATTALLRPGAMGSGSHQDYIKVKHGEKNAVYDWGTEDATKDTYGIMVYQEQIIRIIKDVAGFSLADSEGVRKAIGKKIKEKMDSYRLQFIAGAIKNSCIEKDAVDLWNKIVTFAGYSFNLAHAVCYALTGYNCAWFKYHYPLEFWTTAFQFAKEHSDILSYIIEIRKTGSIQIQTPDINKSGLEFYSSVEENTIYWNLTQIKYVGDTIAQYIIDERNSKGKFFSIDEFAERVAKKEVNKRSVENIVLAGGFDKLYGVKNFRERYGILKIYYDKMKIKMPEQYEANKDIEYFWSIKQGEITGYSTMDYHGLIQLSKLSKNYKQYMPCEEFMLSTDVDDIVVIAGNLSEIKTKYTKQEKKPFITGYITQEDSRVPFRIWSNELLSDKLEFNGIGKVAESEGRLCIMRGNLKFNDFPTINSNELVLNSRLSGEVFQIF